MQRQNRLNRLDPGRIWKDGYRISRTENCRMDGCTDGRMDVYIKLDASMDG